MSSARTRRAGELVVPGLACALAGLTLIHGCRRQTQPREAEPIDAAPNPSVAASVVEEEERPKGNLAFRITDPNGKAIPVKLTLIGQEGTRDPELSKGPEPVEVEGGIAVAHRVFARGGRGAFALPHGRYQVFVSHGPEWTLHTETLTIGTKPVELVTTLEHVVDVPGFVTADFHVHAAPSWDSKVPLSARVLEFLAEDVKVLVATDHNVITDYRGEIDKADASQELDTVAGAEISTTDWGHFGAYPMKLDPNWWVLHGVRTTGLPARDLLRALRQRDPAAIICVNHPRLGKLGYFNIGGFDPKVARFLKPQASLDFDAIELMNGAKDGDREAVDRVLEDWFALLRAGRRITATGNSDTHDLVGSYAGYPRNYVEVPQTVDVDGDQLASALREGSAFLSSGPVVSVDAGGHSLGERVRPKDGKLSLALRVRAAAWISVSELRVYVNGEVALRRTLPASDKVLRFEETVDVPVPNDAFVVVRVDGDRPLPPVVGSPKASPLYPIAITNPIWVDANGDGRYAPKPP